MRSRRAVQNGAGWILPSLMLVLLPKCPLCLAAAVSLLFGIGLSAHAAAVVHGAVIALCIVAIAVFVTRQVLSWLKRQSTRQGSSSFNQSVHESSTKWFR